MSIIKDEIRISDDYTSIITCTKENEDSKPVRYDKIISTNLYIKKINDFYNKNTNDLFILNPPNCRYIENIADKTIVIIEEPPTIRTIKVQMSLGLEIAALKKFNKWEEYGYTDEDYKSYSKNRIHTFGLAFPFTIFILVFDSNNRLTNGQVFLKTSRIFGTKDELFLMPMLNISQTQSICFGELQQENHTSLHKAVENVIFHYWSNIFTTDYMYNYEDYKNVVGVNTYLGWQALTNQDPMFIYKVDWIKYPKNIQEILIVLRQRYERKEYNLTYDSLCAIHSNKTNSDKIKKDIEIGKKNVLIYDTSSSIELEKGFSCFVGDKFKLPNGKILTIDSFMSFSNSIVVNKIRVVTETGRGIILSNSNKIKKIIINGIRSLTEELKGYFKNGIEVKPGDIVKLKLGDWSIYQKIKSMRKSPIGDYTEARTTHSFYILENIEGEVLNFNSKLLNGKPILENEEYVFTEYKNNYGPLFHLGRNILFNMVDIKEDGEIIYAFTTINSESGRNINIIISEDRINSGNIFSIKDEAKLLPPTFVHNRKIYSLIFKRDYTESKVQAYATKYGIVSNNFNASAPKIANIIETCLNKENTEFSVVTSNMSISFKIGDKVVVSDWKQPEEMLKIRTIASIIITKNESINFLLSDKFGNTITHNYVDLKNFIINVGTMRKIVNQIDKYKTGDKIRAKEASISGFPKKDTNIIIGFLIDCAEPQVLCSNCLTLRISDLDSFVIIPYGSKNWTKYEHEPIDINKIKIQPGDILSGKITATFKPYDNATGWYVSSTNKGTLKMLNINSSNDMSPIPSNYKNYLLFDCFLSPRINFNKSKYVPGYYTLHGDSIQLENSISDYFYIPIPE